MTQNNLKPLLHLRNGDKFTHLGELYTVYGHDGIMTEVFKKGKFWAWNNQHSKGLVKVNQVYL